MRDRVGMVAVAGKPMRRRRRCRLDPPQDTIRVHWSALCSRLAA